MAFFPPPVHDPIAQPARPHFRGKIDPMAGLVGNVWVEWFTQLTDDVDEATLQMSQVNLTLRAASIAATDMTDGTISGGMYKITYYTRITRAATTSSSLTITFAWTDDTSPTYSGAAITGNTTTSVQSGSIMIRADSNSPITYATTYVSVGATSMQYKLDITLETVPRP